MRSAMKPEPMRLTMPKPSISDSISAPRAHAVTEVAAIGDDMDLRHRHRDAAGDARDAAAARTAYWRDTPRFGAADDAVRAALRLRRAHLHCAGSISDSGIASDAEDADADMGRAPAHRRDEVLGDRRPDRAARHSCRDAAIATAMPRRFSNQCDRSAISGPKDGRAAEADQRDGPRDRSQRLAREPRADIANAEQADAEHDRRLTMPKRSASRPSITLPTAKPTIAMV